MWLIVMGVTLIVFSVCICEDTYVLMNCTLASEIKHGGSYEKLNAHKLALCGACFCWVWTILGAVWFFWFLPGSTFYEIVGTNTNTTGATVNVNNGTAVNGGTVNDGTVVNGGGATAATTSHAATCKILEQFGHSLIICLLVVPCVLQCLFNFALWVGTSSKEHPFAPAQFD